MSFIKKMLTVVSITLLVTVVGLFPTKGYAKETSTSAFFGITKLRSRGTPLGYGISNPKDGGAYIWNVQKYESKQDKNPKNVGAYCLRAEWGFGTEGASSSAQSPNEAAEYTTTFDLDTDQQIIASKSTDTLKNLAGSQYQNIVNLLDLMYVPGVTSEQYKQTLLRNAGISTMSEYTLCPMTDDDIEAMQQAALWYFTNYRIYNDSKFNKTGASDTAWIHYTTDAATNNYPAFSDYSDGKSYGRNVKAGALRDPQMRKLYNYLITEAQKSSSAKDTGTPFTIKQGTGYTIERDASNENFIVGPINIAKNNDLDTSISIEVHNGKSSDVSSNCKVLDSSKQEISSSNLQNKLQAGGNFYIKVPISGNEEGDLKITFNQKYTTKVKTLYWNSSTNQEQPIVVLENKDNNVPTDFTATPPKGEFDLKLTKRITKVNDQSVPERITKADTSKLNTTPKQDTTATFTMSKEPVLVKAGDLVTYTFRIYNEGYVDGYAEEISEDIPEGLEFMGDSATAETEAEQAAVRQNKEWGWEEKDSYTIKTAYLSRQKNQSGNLIKAFGANPDGSRKEFSTENYKEVSVIFRVKEDAPVDDILINEACISQDADSEGKDVDDRDSVPGTGNSEWPGKQHKNHQDDEDYDNVTLVKGGFDLALRKYITELNAEPTENRAPTIVTDSLKEGTTATYNHRKDPKEVKVGDKVTYNISVYNEGDEPGYATEIIDQLPTGLKFLELKNTPDWKLSSYTSSTNRVVFTRNTDAVVPLDPYTEGRALDTDTLTIVCEVTAQAGSGEDKVLTNVAWISKEYNSKTKETITDKVGADRDSEPATTPNVTADGLVSSDKDDYNTGDIPVSGDSTHYWKGQQDDDDFEKVVIKKSKTDFDLKLLKRIEEVNGVKTQNREITADTSQLNRTTGGSTTATYGLDKTTIKVHKGDIIKYTFRIYNEGLIDGYAAEITEDIPDGLEFIYSTKTDGELDADTEFTPEEKAAIRYNQDYLWGPGDTEGTITTNYLSKEIGGEDNLIKAFGENPNGSKTFTEDNWKEISVYFKVTDDAQENVDIRNEAEISEATDANGDKIDDRDSSTETWKKYEDDEDYDKVAIDSTDFDLALRKFIVGTTKDISQITSINDLEQFKKNGVYERAPQVDTSKLNQEVNGKKVTTADYNHTKEPLTVTVGDYVIYMLRVYNEGDINGYAAQISDYLPNYLEYVDCEFNTSFGWQLEEGIQVEGTGQNRDPYYTTKYLEGELINAAVKKDNGYELSYKEVPIICRVKNDAKSNYKITNQAEISEYQDENHAPATDRDSKEDNMNVSSEEDKPGYKDNETGKYIPGQEDDDDFEKVIVRVFDLSLRKWVSQVIVIEDGAEHRTPTGHDPYDQPEEVVKVELAKKRLNTTTVKFVYGIRVKNEGDIAGYAKEITDYIPEGMEMLEADNPNWKKVSESVATTDQLAGELLNPGDYKDIEITLKWKNGENNLSQKINTAEISKDENEYGIPDVDSVPGNKTPGEDDIDDAPVILSLATGRIPLYIGLTLGTLIILGGGIFLIKKYVIK